MKMTPTALIKEVHDRDAISHEQYDALYNNCSFLATESIVHTFFVCMTSDSITLYIASRFDPASLGYCFSQRVGFKSISHAVDAMCVQFSIDFENFDEEETRLHQNL